jgi:hypothetical protein
MMLFLSLLVKASSGMVLVRRKAHFGPCS